MQAPRLRSSPSSHTDSAGTLEANSPASLKPRLKRICVHKTGIREERAVLSRFFNLAGTAAVAGFVVVVASGDSGFQ